LNQWVARHRWIAMFLYYMMVWLPVVLVHIALRAQISPWWAIYGFIMLCFSYLWSGSARTVLFNKNNLFCAYCNTGRTEELSFLLQKARQILANLKVKEEVKRGLQDSHHMNFAEFHIVKREYELAESFLAALDFESACMRRKVGIHFSKAQILMETGRPQEAQQHLAFVLEHGNNLYLVECAKEYLEAAPR